MELVGRNAPCPCGSGRKFKKCCLVQPATGRGAFTRAERGSALASLTRFAHRPEFDDEHERADDAFWEEGPAGLTDDEGERLDEVDDEDQAFHTWFCFDHRLRDERTLAGVFLDRDGHRLRAGGREYLTRMGATQLRLTRWSRCGRRRGSGWWTCGRTKNRGCGRGPAPGSSSSGTWSAPG
jgi:hypothetical protein